MLKGDLDLLMRMLLGFVLAYVIGFERQLRGSSAGDRTFALVGAATAAVTAAVAPTSPQAVAGIITGIGFIGGGVVFRSQSGLIRGLTTAATIFATAGIGVLIGYGHLVGGVVITALLLLLLEIQHIPFLRWLDAERYRDRFADDRNEEPTSQP